MQASLIRRLEHLEEREDERSAVIFPRYYNSRYYVDGNLIDDLKNYMSRNNVQIAIVNDLPKKNEKGELIL